MLGTGRIQYKENMKNQIVADSESVRRSYAPYLFAVRKVQERLSMDYLNLPVHRETERIFRELLPKQGMTVREEQVTLCHHI